MGLFSNVFQGLFGRNENTPLPDFTSPDYNAFRDGGLNVSLSLRKGYRYFELVGMYYHLNDTDYGRFNGYAIAETDNVYDDYAVAIYEDGGKQVGYLKKGRETKKIHQYILSEGGKVHAYGFTQVMFNGKWYGAVCVEEDKTKVFKRNKPYTPSESQQMVIGGNSYTTTKHTFQHYYLQDNLNNLCFPQEWVGKKFSMVGSLPPYTQKDVADWFKSNGALFVGSVSSKVDFLVNFDPSINGEWDDSKQLVLAKKYNTKQIKGEEFFSKTHGKYKVETQVSYY